MENHKIIDCYKDIREKQEMIVYRLHNLLQNREMEVILHKDTFGDLVIISFDEFSSITIWEENAIEAEKEIFHHLITKSKFRIKAIMERWELRQ